MSDTITQDCNCCKFESDCINGLCESCSDYNYKLQKKADLLTLGLLQEKNKINALLEACKMVNNSIFQDRDGEWQLSRPAELLKTIVEEAISLAEKQ